MEKKYRIILINASFQKKYYYRRWQLFAHDHPDFDVTLLTPAVIDWYSKSDYTFNGTETVKGQEIDESNFHIRLFRINILGISWLSTDYKGYFKTIQPDVIYHIGTHRMLSLIQVARMAHRFCPQAKLMLFSMRGPSANLRIDHTKCSIKEWITRRLRYVQMKLTWEYVREHYSAIFCHYPEAVNCFLHEGYNGHIYMQTQVGVNAEWFHEDSIARKEIRTKYQIDDHTYVFGSATRFTKDKGIDVILEALPVDGNWKYLMMGAGSLDDISRLREIIKRRHLEDKVIETGFVDWYEIAKYWNAVDCAIHVPITTPEWEETFSLAAIQPQMTKKPVIGSSSGSVPYQLGNDNMIVPENDIAALRDKLSWVLSHQEEARIIGNEMFNRTLNSFEIQHLNDLFYFTVMDELDDKYDTNKMDMTNGFC